MPSRNSIIEHKWDVVSVFSVYNKLLANESGVNISNASVPQ